MSEKNLHALMVTVLLVAVLAAVVVLALCYHGDVGALLGTLVTVGLAAWIKIDAHGVRVDNQASNEIGKRQMQFVAIKAESVSRAADSVNAMAAATIDKAAEVVQKVDDLIPPPSDTVVVERNAAGNYESTTKSRSKDA